jgi:DNA-binding NarL/FixJ family response regulator
MATTAPITVLLAEDHLIVRQGLCALLKADGAFRIVGEARTGREAVELARQLRPQVILMDIAMPVLNGLEATRQILTTLPDTKVMILSAHSDEEYIQRAAAAGAFGFLEKQSSTEILSLALREVAQGRRYYSPAVAARQLRAKSRELPRGAWPQTVLHLLTSRETEVLQLVAEGCSNKQVAAELRISIKTVEKHRKQLMSKLKLHDTAGLTRHAIAAGVIESSVQLTIV